MIQRATVWGVSMAERSHRRALVVGSYGVLILTAVVVALALPSGWYRDRDWYFLVLSPQFLVLFAAFRFHHIVDSYELFSVKKPPVERAGIQLGLGLTATSAMKEMPLDEREIKFRDVAFFVAYKKLCWMWLLFSLCIWICAAIRTERAMSIAIQAVLLFVIVQNTLPVALVLWNEPDLVEEEASTPA
jgi:hypothetical protein